MMKFAKLLSFSFFHWILQSPVFADPVDRVGHFLDTNAFLKSDDGSKLTGDSCNPDLLRPCRFPDDICTSGIHPKCRPRKGRQSSRVNPQKTETFVTTTENTPTTTPLTSLTLPSIKLLEEDLVSQEEARLGGKITENKNNQIFRQAAKVDDSDLNALTTLPPSVMLIGNVTWDGSPDIDKPGCLLNHIINEEINGANNEEEKNTWVQEHSNEICNFRKFQVCVEPYITNEANEANPLPEDLAPVEKGICRCFEVSYVLVEGVCYIPAGLGGKSNCGLKKINYIPATGNDAGYPDLKPSCVPNSECVSSPQYFGLRCRCKRWAKLDRIRNTCAAYNLRITKTPIVIGLTLNFAAILYQKWPLVAL